MIMIKLKETIESDFEDYYQIRCSPSDIYWNGYKEKPDKEAFREIFVNRISTSPFDKPEDRRIFLIQAGENNVGFIQLIYRADGIEIGYSVTEKNQRKGYASKAVSLAIEIARKYSSNIYVTIRDDNFASQKVAISNGFVASEDYEIKYYYNHGNEKLRKYFLIK